MAAAPFTEHQVPDLAGQIVVVTGPNSGLGFETVRVLAAHHATVIMAGRSPERCGAARARIVAVHREARVEVLPLDLGSVASIRDFAREFRARFPRLDVLCNNAGVMAVPYALTQDGLEQTVGVNHFGHFALTGLLLDSLLRAPAPRVVTVSSLMHRSGRLARTVEVDSARGYAKWRAYSNSKLYNLLFAFELDRRVRAAGGGLVSVAAHPGYSVTNLAYVGPRATRSRWQAGIMAIGHALFAQSSATGAMPQIFAATAPGVVGGEFFGPRGPFEMWGAPTRVTASARARDLGDAARLWELSVDRTRIDFAALRAP